MEAETTTTNFETKEDGQRKAEQADVSPSYLCTIDVWERSTLPLPDCAMLVSSRLGFLSPLFESMSARATPLMTVFLQCDHAEHLQ